MLARLLLLTVLLVSAGDWITVNTGSADPFSLLVAGYFPDGKNPGCGWRVFSGTGAVPIAMPNLLSTPRCPAEAIVASPHHAMRLQPLDGLTDRANDRATINAALSGPSKVRVVARPIDDALTPALRRYIETANQVFDRCGITFDLVVEPTPVPPVDRARLEGAGCDQADELRQSAGRSRGAVNVYLLKERPHYRGAWCGNGESPYKDVVLLYRSASAATLAHEIGHALALEHPPFIDDNLMADIGDARHLTLGQCFRSHFAVGSILSASTGSAPRRCDDSKDGATSRCPPLELDVP